MVWCVLRLLQVKKAPPIEQPSTSSAASQEEIAIGKLRGEDYNFEFQGKVKDGKMHFRLFMTQVCTVCVLGDRELGGAAVQVIATEQAPCAPHNQGPLLMRGCAV